VATVLTHALVGSMLAPAGPKGTSRRRLALALAVLAVLPDLDVAAFALGIPYAHPLGHRGFSHSLAFALLAAWCVARFEFPQVPRPSKDWWRLFAVLAAGAASHGLLDALTDGGLGVAFLLPFDSRRFFLPFRPLAVSPIGLSAFLRGPALEVLRSEILYVWLPLAAIALVAAALRRSSRGSA
jgi:inner membrane protein